MVHHGQQMYTNIELLQYIQNVARGLLLRAICVLLRLAIMRREEHARNIRSKSCTSNPSRRLPQRRTSEQHIQRAAHGGNLALEAKLGGDLATQAEYERVDEGRLTEGRGVHV